MIFTWRHGGDGSPPVVVVTFDGDKLEYVAEMGSSSGEQFDLLGRRINMDIDVDDVDMRFHL